MTTHWAAVDPDDSALLHCGDCEPAWEASHPRDVESLNDISKYQETNVICSPCAAAADNHLTHDFHCDDPGCTCGHRVERYGTTTTGQTVTTGGGEPG